MLFFTDFFNTGAFLCCGLDSGVRTMSRMGDLRKKKKKKTTKALFGEAFSGNSSSKPGSNPEWS